MNQHLQHILSIFQQDENLSAEQKAAISKSLKDADKEMEITAFKLDRTEKVKRTTAILLEETIEELEQKRTAVEAQNRELAVESSLQRVRTVAMSMNKADDMLRVCGVISQELEQVNIKEIRNVQTAIFYPAVSTYINYEYYTKHRKTFVTETTYNNNQKHEAFADTMQKGAGQFFELTMNGEEVKEWIAYQKTTNVFIDDFLYDASSLNYYWCSLGPVALGLSTYEALSESDKDLFKRFSNVFELAYSRYLDIEKAAAQAREAQIQLALERVRARTMAMHHSTELAQTSSVLFQQIKDLGFETWSCGFCIWTKEDMAELWMGADSGGLLPPMLIPYKDEPTHQDIHEAFLQKKSAHHKIWEGEALQKHYQFLETIPSVKTAIEQLKNAGLSLPFKQCYYVGFFKLGYLLLITKEPDPALEDLSKRFASVFDLTYTRFLDLQKAEAQAKEAQIETALERVRSRSMAMRKSEELAELSLELVKQVQALGVATWFCAFNIYDDDPQGSMEWGSNGQGTFPKYRTPREGIFLRYFEAGQRGETLVVNEIGENECGRHYEYLCTLPGVGDQLLNMKEAGIPFPVSQIDHVAFFKYGYVLFITYEPMPEAHDIFKRFAKVFEQTYTRFLDLQKAEAQAEIARLNLIQIQQQKQRAEDALTELQLTQKQLIQSEKMASLGELTAGIAHEIQNPLNFVNNFSEVSNELIDEMMEEVEKGNYEEVKAIADDVKQNLQKINHHGRRADGIVKGMLQHSRSSSATKEPTDINALADEYLRLAYHGLRAKDKSFNATLKTDYDETIGSINIIPQDLGRVILNLITNAFYAVGEKKKEADLEGFGDYQPMVSISTKKVSDKIELRVQDNGGGIPKHIVDKIFQPFFTTKPTGQGTGLGLSLAYDIVKAHGGNLKAATKEGEGTGFIIELPIV